MSAMLACEQYIKKNNLAKLQYSSLEYSRAIPEEILRQILMKYSKNLHIVDSFHRHRQGVSLSLR